MKTLLYIVYNEFYPKKGIQYIEVKVDEEDMSSEDRELSREPKKARFDEVYETSCGSYSHWNACRAKRLYGHPLQKR